MLGGKQARPRSARSQLGGALQASSHARGGLAIEPLESRLLLTVVQVVAINRDTPAAVDVHADSVRFRVTFSEAVFGVDGSDFQIATTGTVTADRPIEVTGSGTTYLATLSGVQGAGTLRLDLVDDDSIVNGTAVPLGGTGVGNGDFAGQSYNVDQLAPFVQSINRTDPSNAFTGATTVVYTVTFSEPVLGVVAANFVPVTGGSVTANATVDVAGSGTSYTVSIDQVQGSGTLELDLVDLGTIHDLAGNQLVTASSPISFDNQATSSTGVVPIFVTADDLNADGRADLVVANFLDNNVSVLLGNGDGSFADQVTYPTGVNPNGVAIADVNGDNLPDLIVANFGGNNISVLLGNGDGTFQGQSTFAAGTNPQSVAAGDFNGDGRIDVAVANFGGGNLSILLGNGQGLFSAAAPLPSGPSPQSVRVADFNRDGFRDLVATNFGNNTLSVFLGNGDGTFQSQAVISTGSKPRGVTVADVNGDANPDLIVANSGDDNVGVMLGSGNGAFLSPVTYSVGTNPWSVAVADVNGDGRRDLVVGNSSSNNVSVLRGVGDGTFLGAVAFATGRNPQSVITADLNLDSKIDLVIANFLDGNVSVLPGNGRGDFSGQVYTIESATHLGFTAIPGETVAGTALGGAGGVRVAALDRLGNVVVDDHSTVTLSLVGGSFAGGVTSVQAPLVDGIASFIGLTINTAGTYALTATDGTLDPATSQNFTVVSTIVGRNLFYKGSPRYDVTNSRFPGFSDDNAIATDKVALLPGPSWATFANVSSYSGGITGVMVDLLGGSGVGIADFSFKVGNSNSPGMWWTAPSPTSILVRPGAGVSGSDRIELIWAPGAIKKTWLQVVVAANARTGLESPDTFYFGNAVGDSGLGDTSAQAIVDSVDETGARDHPQSLLSNIPITNIYDYNRDGAVDGSDQLISRSNATTTTTALNFIYVPATTSVLDRRLFYKGSSHYNVTNTQFPGFSDDNAIAIDKVAYLPGTGAATFANLSSYSGGITGIMIDLFGPGSHSSITAGDFIFKVGNNNMPSAWWTAPAPSTVTVRPGAGVSGSDRVELIWAAGVIKKTWLEVITLADSNTGLSQSPVLPANQADVFFFGNALADSGQFDTATSATVDGNDELAARNHPQSVLAHVPITNPYDYNRDGAVDGNDQLLSRNNATSLANVTRFLNLSNPPAAPTGTPMTEPSIGTGDASLVAAALAASTGASDPTRPAIAALVADRVFDATGERADPPSKARGMTVEGTDDAFVRDAREELLAEWSDADDSLELDPLVADRPAFDRL
jgi:hypothetical protein